MPVLAGGTCTFRAMPTYIHLTDGSHLAVTPDPAEVVASIDKFSGDWYVILPVANGADVWINKSHIMAVTPKNVSTSRPS